MAFVPITDPEVDAKSPLDDALFAKIQADLADLNARIVLAGASPYVFDLQGQLNNIRLRRRSVSAAIVNEDFTPSRCRYVLKKSATLPFGDLSFDIRKHTAPRSPIQSILPQYTGLTQSIGRCGSALTTQSVARITTQIATQSITFAKASNNVQSIVLLGTVAGVGSNLVQYNLANPIDSDTQNGDSILFASCTTGANNGTFVIVEKNRGGGNNVVVPNGSGVAQTGVAGNGQVQLMSYNFTNPVDSNFITNNYSHLFASHTTGANNGTFGIRAINQSGNNIWIMNPSGVAQGGVAGTVDCNIWKFVLSSAASTTDYIVGETALTTSHTTGGNNQAALPIVAVNQSGNNLVLYNSAGAVQAGVAGNINTNRWIYAMGSDPSSQVTAGYGLYLTSHSSGGNNGYFVAKEVNRSAANNVVIFNESGVAQGGVAGQLITTRRVVSFSTDQSSKFTATTSYVEMRGCVDGFYNYYWAYAPFQVVQVNRGGGANFNIVIEVNDVTTGVIAAGPQVSAAGYVQTEMKSIFSSPPIVFAADNVGLEPSTNIVGTSTAMVAAIVPANTPLMLYLTTTPNSGAEDLTVIVR